MRRRDQSRPAPRRRARYRAAAALAVAAVVTASLLPADGSTAATTLLGVGADKWLHAASYAVIAALVAAGFPRPWPVVVGTVATLGLGVELAQLPVPTRAFSLLDAGVNAVGATVGVAARRLAAAAGPPDD